MSLRSGLGRTEVVELALSAGGPSYLPMFKSINRCGSSTVSASILRRYVVGPLVARETTYGSEYGS
jgi:hypothetical protein